MRRRSARPRAAAGAVAGCILAIPTIGSALDPERDATVWAPALVAWGAQLAPPPGTRGAPLLSAGGQAAASSPALVTVGQGVAGAVPDLPAPIDETQRWVPGFALQSGMLGQNAEGSVDSNSTITYEYVVQENPLGRPTVPGSSVVVTRSLREGKVNYFSFRGGAQNPFPTAFTPGTPSNPGPSSPSDPPANSNPRPGCPTCTGGLVLPAKGSNLLLTPFVGLSTEIMTPGLQEAPGRPRLFLHSDASLAFSLNRSVGREGVPEGASFPPVTESPLPIETEVKGIGSSTTTELKTLLVSGGIGVAFTLDAWERRLRIKPSFEYVRQQIEVTGKLYRAFRQNTGFRGPPLVPSVYLPPIALESSDELTSYGIGPGLELEMDAGRAGPVMLSVFVGGQAYRMLGDRDVHLEDTAQIDVPDNNPTTPATQEVSAQWDFHTHAWSYRGGLGVRFRWLPEGR